MSTCIKHGGNCAFQFPECHPVAKGAPYGLQMDLLSAVARLRQIRDEPAMESYLVWRMVNCDLPRLEGHLTSETVAWMEKQEESWHG